MSSIRLLPVALGALFAGWAEDRRQHQPCTWAPLHLASIYGGGAVSCLEQFRPRSPLLAVEYPRVFLLPRAVLVRRNGSLVVARFISTEVLR